MKRKKEKKKEVNWINPYLTKKNIFKWTIMLIVLILTIYLAFNGYFKELVMKLGRYGVIGIFFTGVCWGYSVASIPATALFVFFAKTYNPLVIALIGAAGVVTENILVFIFFEKEIPDSVKKKVDKLVYEKFKLKGKNWLIIIIAMIIMTTPIPNEFGIYLLTVAKFNERLFMLFSFITSSIGIFIIASIGTIV